MTTAATMSDGPAASSVTRHASPVTRHPSLWLLLAVLLGFWAVLIYRLSGMWTALPEYSYGWVVPLLCAMMFWERRRSRPALECGDSSPLFRGGTRPAVPLLASPGAGFSAFCFLFLCLSGFVLARLSVEVIPTWRFALWLMAFATLGLTWLTLGMMGGLRWVGHFFFPVFFFLLAVPWPTAFEVPFIQTLTQLNAAITVEALSFLNVIAVRMGNLILIEPGMVGVQEACSGIRSFQSTLMVALFLGELFRFNLWRRLVFVVLGASCSMLFNILRTSFLVWSCNEEGLSAVDKFHDPAGWAVFAASFATLALIGWRLKRGDAKEKAEGGKRGRGERENGGMGEDGGKGNVPGGSPGTTGPSSAVALLRRVDGSPVPPGGKAESGKRKCSTIDCEPRTTHEPATCNLQPATRPAVVRGPVVRRPGSVVLAAFLLFTLVATEFGLRWWFTAHRAARSVSIEWQLADTARTRELAISREVRAMLAYDEGQGWEAQGGGGERWQAFYFVWEPPRNLGRKIVSSAATMGHQPEVCFTAAGMQLRKLYGYRRYVANGVPLVFKVYEFADRNVPIFVFASTWERGVEQRLDDGLQIAGEASTARGFREAIARLRAGDRGIVDEVRVFKLGVWGPRTIGEAEAAFQQQLNQLVQPVTSGG